jgi:soluble lytic murein transglycosylase-like protein
MIIVLVVVVLAGLAFTAMQNNNNNPNPVASASADPGAIQAQIVSTATQFGIDPSLALAVAQQESGMRQFNATGGVLTSKAGALGVFQLEPATAQGLGVDPTDTTQNIQGGVQYLAQLLGKYQGDVNLTLAAYNAGPGNVDKYGGIPPFPETQAYVASVQALQQNQFASYAS